MCELSAAQTAPYAGVHRPGSRGSQSVPARLQPAALQRRACCPRGAVHETLRGVRVQMRGPTWRQARAGPAAWAAGRWRPPPPAVPAAGSPPAGTPAAAWSAGATACPPSRAFLHDSHALSRSVSDLAHTRAPAAAAWSGGVTARSLSRDCLHAGHAQRTPVRTRAQGGQRHGHLNIHDWAPAPGLDPQPLHAGPTCALHAGA